MTQNVAKFVRAVGITLIVLGILALAGQFLPISIGRVIWPLLIVFPGVLLFVFATSVEGALGEPLAMVAGMITMVGILLLYQSLTEHWASWAYAWTLIAPTGVGLAEMLYGWISNRDSAVRTGATLVNIGVIMFLVGLFFFELILNISGLGLGFIGWPILFIGLGVIVLLRGLLRKQQ
ncbi:MAG: hypothetical protein ACP5HS_05230 [Anaerolineae bacterium]